MSSFLLFGNFAVAGATRVSSPKKVANGSSVATSHYVYDTTISFPNAPSVQASLRVYSPGNAIPFAAQTIIFAFAKAHAPAHGTILLDALSVFPYPGNCEDDDYEDRILDFPGTFAFFTGLVRNQTRPLLTDGTSRSFTVDVSEFVRNTAQPSTLQAVFEGSNVRWSKTPTPNPRTTVQVFGHCRGLATNGMLSITVDNITFNVGSWAPPDLGPDNGGPPKKRRKLTAYASHNSNVSTTSPPSIESVPSLAVPSMPFNLITPMSGNPAFNSSMIPFDNSSNFNTLSMDGLSAQASTSTYPPLPSSSTSFMPSGTSLSTSMMPASSSSVVDNIMMDNNHSPVMPSMFVPLPHSTPLTPLPASPVMVTTPVSSPMTSRPSAKAKGKRKARN